jgi:hypothetical protein
MGKAIWHTPYRENELLPGWIIPSPARPKISLPGERLPRQPKPRKTLPMAYDKNEYAGHNVNDDEAEETAPRA